MEQLIVHNYFRRSIGKSDNILVLLILCLCISVVVYRCASSVLSPSLSFDAKTFYLPMANRFLVEGMSLFRDQEFIYRPPLSVLYPAALGVNIFAIKLVNVVLYCLSMLLVFDLVRMAHSYLAAVFSVLALSFSPLLLPFIPTVLSEPPNLFFTTVWMWAVTRLLANPQINNSVIWIGGLALSLALLFRMTYIYFLYALLLLAIIALCYGVKHHQQLIRKLLLMHSLTFIVIFAIMLTNYYIHDFFGVATGGAGNALYYGNHLLTSGYEHPQLGLEYDENTITQGINLLSIEGDALLKKAALVMIGEHSLSELISLYGDQFASFLFLADLTDPFFNPSITPSTRILRFTEVLLAVVGLYSIRHCLTGLFLLACIVYQSVVHVPSLYVHRYSICAIEIPLIILAAIGLSGLFYLPFNKTGKRKMLLFLVVSWVVLTWIRFVGWSQRIEPDISKVPHDQLLVMDQNTLQEATIDNLTDNHYSVKISGYQPGIRGGNQVLSLLIHLSSATRCDTAEVIWLPSSVETSTSKPKQLSIKQNNADDWYHIGTLHPLNIKGDGILSIHSDCASEIIIKRLIISVDNTAMSIRKKILR